MTESIKPEVLREDARLEQAAEGTRLALAKHRWHWTLDESNPGRVSMNAYAKAIGRHHRTLADMVHGYQNWVAAGAAATEFSDYQAREKLRGETREATEAVAEAKGIGVESARRHHADEVREVKAAAQERAERKGTQVADEIKHVANSRASQARSEKKREEERKEAHTLRYLEAEGKIATAMRYLRALLDDTSGVPFTDEETELLSSSLGQLRALLNLLDVRLLDATDIDWDAEMAKMTGGAR